jgi:hypothetical protein
MSKLTAHNFQRSATRWPSNAPSYEGVKAKYVAPERLIAKLPEGVYRVFAKEKSRRRSPQAWILKLKHRDHKAYAIVSRLNYETLEVRVLDKHGKIITKNKQSNYDAIGE